jgi:hypothetical protein
MSKTTYEHLSRVVSFSLKLVGVLGIVFVPVFWAFTNRIELALLPFFASLATTGLGVDLLLDIVASRSRMPPPDSKEETL